MEDESERGHGSATRPSTAAQEPEERHVPAESTGPTHGYVLRLDEIGRTHTTLVGGKGAHLGELSRIEGLRVPSGFCVSTRAFAEHVAHAGLDPMIERLARLHPTEVRLVRALGAEIRAAIETLPIARDVAAAVSREVAWLDERGAYAVRSSATAEDLPTASFAGLQDTYLNVVGVDSILEHIVRCWASLFAERAVSYRRRKGFDERSVRMAVVVQRMVVPDVSGVLFTADPVTGNRKVSAVEAIFGLGEALVSGLVNCDTYQVRGDKVVGRSIASKRRALHPRPAGGTHQRELGTEKQNAQTLSDNQVVELARVGRHIEVCLGGPQDVEWCLAQNELHIVQSRPITTLFPVPQARDEENRVYLSVGHQQMMTDPMKPLGLSVWQLTSRAPMCVAGGRLFVDVTHALSTQGGRRGLFQLAGRSDPLVKDALETLIERDFVQLEPAVPTTTAQAGPPPGKTTGPAPAPLETIPVPELIERWESSLNQAKKKIGTLSGPALVDFILDDLGELQRLCFDPQSHRAVMASAEATWWLNEHVNEWLGEKNAADLLAQGVPDNVTSEMGWALLDVADAVRPHPEIVAYLRQLDEADQSFLNDLHALPGGHEVCDAFKRFLDVYGARGVGEIDISRPRFAECPALLVPLLLGNVDHCSWGEGARRRKDGRKRANEKRRQLVERLRVLPEGEDKAKRVEQRIDELRTFAGYREYPKFGMVSRYFVYKQALMNEAKRLVLAKVLPSAEDIFFFTLQELREVSRTHQVDHALLRERQQAFESYRALQPPRVLTSEGECLFGSHRRDDVPDGALSGLVASSGTVEGRARVVLTLADAKFDPGDILVTTYTDPSWTPAFLAIAGLVTEVGGMMTHGSVIAREYGLPAIVGVDRATQIIRDGQRIRIDGTGGTVEILE